MTEREPLRNEFSPYSAFMVYCKTCKDILFIAVQDTPDTRSQAEAIRLADQVNHAQMGQKASIFIIELPKPPPQNA